MPKTHMGWAKRTIEKEKRELEEQKAETERKRIMLEHQHKQQQMQLQMQQQMAGAPRPSLRELGVPTGPNLARTRVSDEPHVGTVIEWLGKYGWIKAAEPINHPLAGRHAGKVYIARQDVISGGVLGAGLTPGQLCHFHVYADANGIGAEQCQAVGQTVG
mmetsp:Transcript_56781/g.158102  ORF Transcript_56781/g.158102 Transcript_56781/m.158102 type:complete len:160 (-) Transcript_56781:83-562(-)